MTDKGFHYRHSEGITDIHVWTGGEDGSKLVTCGSDGDVRVYNSFDDDEPVTFSASDSCLGMAWFENKIVVGTENNTLEMYELPKGKNLGVKTKFTAAVNHVDVSKDGKWLVGGSGDMTIKIISLEDTSSLPRKIDAHSAPVLSVAIDPQGTYVASSGCDGKVCVWFLLESSTRLAKRWDNVFDSSNDITLGNTLCRLSWTPDGQFLAVPQKDKTVTLHSRDGWEPSRSYKSKDLTKMVSALKFSPCGTYLGAGGTDGAIVIWNALTADPILELPATNEKGITGIAFGQGDTDKHVYFTNEKGQLGHVEDFAASSSKKQADNYADVFDDGMDDLFDDVDADNENEISISKIKAQAGYLEDEYVGVDKATKELGLTMNGKDKDLDDDVSSVMSLDSKKGTSKEAQFSKTQVNPFTDPQEPFQPASTPIRLEHRFMVWNNIGIIRSYSTEDDEAIDIEFHDVSVHNSIHLRNQFDFIFGTMSSQVIALACEKADGHPSKLFCLNFASWDSSKEWTVDMPMDEEISGVAVGKGWIAVSTSLNRLRFFSIGGCQKFMYDLPGQVVAMMGHENLIFVTYHSGIGINGNQSIAYSLFQMKDCKLQALKTDLPLPLSSKSTLSWLGFSDEGTPMFSDSKEVFRILNGELWTPYCCMKELLSGLSDHFWVVGASETAQHIRAIKCKGSKYPPTLPRPVLMVLDAKIPICELDTEKSQLEEKMLRAMLLNSITKKMDKKGFDVEEFKETAERDIRESVMKLFVMASKGDRDMRASEYVELMPSTHAVRVAVKYASQFHRMALADHLTRIGRQKMEEEELSDDDVDFETRPKTNFIRYGNFGNVSANNSDYGIGVGGSRTMDPLALRSHDSSDNSTPVQAARTSILEENPLLKKQKDEIRAILTPAAVKGNPFRRDVPKKPDEDSQSQEINGDGGKGLAFIDAWKKPPEKSSVIEFNPKHPQSKRSKKSAADKEKALAAPAAAAKGKKKQPTLFDMGGKMKKSNANIENPFSPSSEANENSCSAIADVENSEPISADAEEFSENDETQCPLPSHEKKRKRSDAEDDVGLEDNEKSENGNIDIADPSEKKKRIALKLSIFSKKQED